MAGTPTVFQGNYTFAGNVAFGPTVAFQSASVQPNAIAPGTTGNFIPAEAVRTQLRKIYVSGNIATAVASEQKLIYRAYKPGTVINFNVGCVVIPIGAATVTVDLKKNNTTILTGVVTLNSSSVARVGTDGTLGGSVNYVAGDVFEVATVATAGGGTLPNSVWGEMVADEDPS